jgi:glycosyltransferase involved in cell wall biosynthesis
VVIPCYNYGRFLPALVDSLLSEPGCEVDVLVVDDCSTDGSSDVVSALADTRPRTRAILHSRNRGHIATYNEGLARAEGDYVVLLSADDFLPRGAITRAVALMEANPTVGLVYGQVRNFDTEVPPEAAAAVRNWSVWSGHDWLARACRTGTCFILSPEVVMRRSAMDQMVGYDVRLPAAADMDLWLRTALAWDIGRVNGPVQAWYRVHGQNMHLTTYPGLLADLLERRRVFDIFYGEHVDGLAHISALQQASLEALAREALRLGYRAKWRDEPLEDVHGYADFAVETWPDIKNTHLWRVFSRDLARADDGALVRARLLNLRARHHIAWRRWVRYGT